MKTTQRIPHSALRIPHSAFTLVEMLVVIAIIGMLAALIIPAVMAARDAAKRGAIVMEISALDTAIKQYKNTYGSFPPNFSDPAAVVRHLKKAFPRIAGSELLLVDSNPDGPISLVNLSPAEAIPFWLGGFSNDPEFPLTGQGGPLFVPLNAADREFGEHGDGVVNLDARTPLFEMDKSRLEEGPTGHILIADPAGGVIDVVLYQYQPKNLEEPYVYFDTSRGRLDQIGSGYGETTDWPIYRSNDGNGIVRALVNVKSTGVLEFINPDSFQILAPGTDGTWSLDDTTDPESGWDTTSTLSTDYCASGYGIPPLFPAGPYTGDMADNLSNFATGAFEDAGEN